MGNIESSDLSMLSLERLNNLLLVPRCPLVIFRTFLCRARAVTPLLTLDNGLSPFRNRHDLGFFFQIGGQFSHALTRSIVRDIQHLAEQGLHALRFPSTQVAFPSLGLDQLTRTCIRKPLSGRFVSLDFRQTASPRIPLITSVSVPGSSPSFFPLASREFRETQSRKLLVRISPSSFFPDPGAPSLVL